jgi:WD40 repeat protein
MRLTFPLLVITLLLSACSNAPAQSTIPPRITSTATFQSTETPTPTETPTLRSTKTPVSKKVMAITETYEAQLSVEATVAALGTICQSPSINYLARISRDGQWIAIACQGVDGEIDSHLQVISLQGDKKWTIHYADYAKGTYYDRRNRINLAHWSTDGKYLYATSESTVSGCCWIGWDLLLIRLNLETGQQTVIADYIDKAAGMNISFSPSDKYILYIPQDGENNLHIWDMQASKERVIKLEDTGAGAGHALMSNDDQKVILVLRDYPKEYQGDLTFGSLVLIDLKNGSQIKLLSGMDYHETPLPVNWQDNDHVLLQKNSEYLLLNINTGELTEAEEP